MRTKYLVSALMLVLATRVVSAECLPTPHRTTGTHYKPVTVEKTDVSTGVIVSGRVMAAPDCEPVASARVAHWQAGEQGRYVDRLRAWLLTDASGQYRFETEWPDLRPPHIHFIVTAEGYEILETQWVGDQRQRTIEFDMVLTATP